jgi:hypothetical protein
MAFLWMGLQRNGFTIVTRPLARGLHEAPQLVDAVEQLVDEQPLVHDVDRPSLEAQGAVLVRQVARVAHVRGVAALAEEVAEHVVLGAVGTSS